MFINGMSINDCESEEESKISRFFKKPNCVIKPHVENIKSNINLFGVQVWNKVGNIRDRIWNKNKDTGDIDFDEIDVEDVTTIRLKRDDEEIENGENETTTIVVDQETTDNSPDYLVPGVQNLLRAPSKCAAGSKLVGGRCRQIW
jgi:hypothetical protein